MKPLKLTFGISSPLDNTDIHCPGASTLLPSVSRTLHVTSSTIDALGTPRQSSATEALSCVLNSGVTVALSKTITSTSLWSVLVVILESLWKNSVAAVSVATKSTSESAFGLRPWLTRSSS